MIEVDFVCVAPNDNAHLIENIEQTTKYYFNWVS